MQEQALNTEMTLKRFSSFALLMGMAFLLGACGIQATKPYKASKDFYYTHINRPLIVDLELEENIEESERRLAERFVLLDKELSKLPRILDSILDPSDIQKTSTILQSLPWISNVCLLNSDTQIVAAMPESTFKAIDYSFLSEKEIKNRAFYTHILEDPRGPEVLAARPYMFNDELQGYLAANFDMRSLLPYVNDPSHVIIMTLDTLLWTGDYLYEDTPFADVNWHEEIKNSSFGAIENSSMSAEWVAHYYGDLVFIFGIVKPIDEANS